MGVIPILNGLTAAQTFQESYEIVKEKAGSNALVFSTEEEFCILV